MPFSSAQRLKPHAIGIRVNIDPVHWFLDPLSGTRTSLYLKDAATDFQVQGLEPVGGHWSFHSFRHAERTDVNKPERPQYLENAC